MFLLEKKLFIATAIRINAKIEKDENKLEK